MIDAFLGAVLPVFVVVALGFVFGRSGHFDFAAAQALNRFVYYVAGPVLLFRLIAAVPFERFDWFLVLGFLLAEIILYATGYVVARRIFHRSYAESLLLGMSAAFANQVFFVLPMARELFGDAGAFPVVVVTTLDVFVLFAGTIVILDTTGERRQRLSLAAVTQLFARNPPIIGIAAGLLANDMGIEIAGGLDFFARFVGETAGPVSLFALGVILVLRRDAAAISLPVTITGLKLVAMPLVTWLLLAVVFRVDPQWANPAMLVAAGPTGAMPFVLALQYHVPVGAIARTILISTLGSLITVTLMTQL